MNKVSCSNEDNWCPGSDCHIKMLIFLPEIRGRTCGLPGGPAPPPLAFSFLKIKVVLTENKLN